MIWTVGLIGFVLTIGLGIISNLSIKKIDYSIEGLKSIIEINLKQKVLYRISFILVIIFPIPFSFILSGLETKSRLYEVMTSFMIIVVFFLIVNGYHYLLLSKKSQAEIEFRKISIDKDNEE